MSPQRTGFLVSALLHVGLFAAWVRLADDSAPPVMRPLLLISFAQAVPSATLPTAPELAATPSAVAPPKSMLLTEPSPVPTRVAAPKLAPAKLKQTKAKPAQHNHHPPRSAKPTALKSVPERPKQTKDKPAWHNHHATRSAKPTTLKSVPGQSKRTKAKPAKHSESSIVPANVVPPSTPIKTAAPRSVPVSAKPIQHSRPPIAALANKVSQLPTKTLNRVATHKAPATLQSRPDEAYYLATLRQAIEAHKRYPRMARHLGIQGRATVAFVLHRDGRITGVQVRTSSGDTGLDAAAFAAVADVERFRPFPEGNTRQTWPISVEIIFSLK